MPLTKLTPRKEAKCPMCRFKTYDMAEMTRHITECGLKNLERKYSCDREDCNFTTNKMGNLTRHMKRHIEQEAQSVEKVQHITPLPCRNQINDKEATAESSPSVDCRVGSSASQDAGKGKEISDEEWINADPGDLRSILGDISETDSEKEVDPNATQGGKDANIGRIFRKPTTPIPVFTPKRKDPLVATSGLPARPMIRRPQVSEIGTQTGKKVRRVESTIAKWREGEKDMERIVMIEED